MTFCEEMRCLLEWRTFVKRSDNVYIPRSFMFARHLVHVMLYACRQQTKVIINFQTQILYGWCSDTWFFFICHFNTFRPHVTIFSWPQLAHTAPIAKFRRKLYYCYCLISDGHFSHLPTCRNGPDLGNIASKHTETDEWWSLNYLSKYFGLELLCSVHVGGGALSIGNVHGQWAPEDVQIIIGSCVANSLWDAGKAHALSCHDAATHVAAIGTTAEHQVNIRNDDIMWRRVDVDDLNTRETTIEAQELVAVSHWWER